MSQVQKKIEISQDESFFNDDLLEKLYSAESSKPYSVIISRSSNPEKKLMGVFEDSEGKKIKTTHFGQRGASDYTKHGEKERMERYLERHGGGFETSTKENWKDPTTAGALSRWILWNKPSLKASFDDYKSRFGLKGSIKVSKSAEDWRDINWETHNPTHDPSPFESIEWEQLPLPPVKIGILMRAFTKSGYSCLIVGGAVRDLMLGLEPKDYDLATDATPDEVKEVVNGLKGYRYVLGPQAEKSILNLTSLVTVSLMKQKRWK